ncbi:outer membrane lipoprotein carrier protein LolA [Rugosimonospora acidiphila]|uniref:Outer membrane lipoprotein carrier protein LolA n=2 Tax=Rugosimonospora acidiphila TaxID=556531 RepID=A0ABP9SLB2_9ACTN
MLSTQLRAAANVSLPARSPAQLMVDVQSADVTGVSGTVVEKADLGLPALPDSTGGDGSSQLNSLVSGSHTLRVWYAGPDKTRVALLGAVGESDIIRNGDDAWIWSSSEDTATHLDLANAVPSGPGASGGVRPGASRNVRPATDLPSMAGAATTPQQAAEQALLLMGATTTVSSAGPTQVAGRPAYVLSLAPKNSDSLIAKVQVAIDAVRHVPTQVEVFAKGHAAAPSFSIGFSQVDFSRPDDDRFAFTPPPNTKVEEGTDQALHQAASQPETAVIGSGWTSILAARLPMGGGSMLSSTGAAGQGSGATEPGLMSFLGSLPSVSGDWGTGHLLQSRLFSVLLTDDGRVLIGAVGGDQLQKAAADPAAALR